MASPASDFSTYMEDLAKSEAAREEEERILSRHQTWLRTTWGGWIVSRIRDVGDHFHPFFLAVGEALRDESNASGRALNLFLRMAVVGTGIVSILIFARLFQTILGRDISVEQEIVIIEEIPRSQAEREGIVEGEYELTDDEIMEELKKDQ